MPSDVLVQLKNVSKVFGGARALSDVSLDFRGGEVHALCGENGAGKSTLIKILGGSYVPDAGSVTIDGVPLERGVRASEAAGIAVIHQESVAFPHLTAAENIFVGREPRRFGGLFLDRAAMRRAAARLLTRLGETDIDLSRPVGELPLAQRQMVGMARALSQQCRLLIMDEPTASLSARETQTLFRVIHHLRSEGVGIVYVSHRMEEIFALGNRASVLRDGHLVASMTMEGLKPQDLIRHMVGRAVDLVREDHVGTKTNEPPMLDVRGLTQPGVFQDVSFVARRGEILGFAGLVGAGRSEVAESIFGARNYAAGTVTIGGEMLHKNSVAAAVRAGLALVPEDRQHLGLVLPISVGANMTLAILRKLAKLGVRSPAGERSTIERFMVDLQVRAASHRLPVEALSGGNQQKVLVAKWLATQPRVLILDEPTRGVDIGAKVEIHRLVRELTRQGLATIVISSDMPEVLALSDRILVMRQGTIAGELAGNTATQEQILSLALPDAAAATEREVA